MFVKLIILLLTVLTCAVLKKMKHRVVEHMSSSTADALGLSRAILCNGKEPCLLSRVYILYCTCIYTCIVDYIYSKLFYNVHACIVVGILYSNTCTVL